MKNIMKITKEIISLLIMVCVLLSIKYFFECEPLKLTRPCFFEFMLNQLICISALPILAINVFSSSDAKPKIVKFSLFSMMIASQMLMLFEMKIEYLKFFFSIHSIQPCYVLLAMLCTSLYLKWENVISKSIPALLSVIYISCLIINHLINEYSLKPDDYSLIFIAGFLTLLVCSSKNKTQKIIVQYSNGVF